MTIAEFIQQDLQTRIAAGRELPGKLTLAGLSAHYAVSPTPVRRAIAGLIKRQYLRKGSNGRLLLSRQRIARSSNGHAPAASPPRTADFEKRIVADVIQRSLGGRGDFLREEATARRYGIGRSVIRQVFSRLAGKGLIEHVPRRGWRVRVLDERDLCQFLAVRETLELQALDLARPRLVRADLERMLAGNPRVIGHQPARLDNRLHGYLIEKSQNRYIQDFFDRHGMFYATLLEHAAPRTAVVARMARQHRQILLALLAQDWPRARRALAQHIGSQRPIVRKLMAQLGRRQRF